MRTASFDAWNERAQHGDLEGLRDHMASLGRSSDPSDHAAALALESTRASLDPKARLPPLEAARALCQSESSDCLEWACGRSALVSSLSLQPELARAWLSLGNSRPPGRFRLALEAAATLADVVGESNPARSRKALETLAKRAREEGDAAVTVQTTALRALLQSRCGDPDGARASARRAARMARTEGLLAEQLFAHAVLARVRRIDGLPHRALRIVSALRGVAPPYLCAWLDWEAWLAGEPSRELASEPGPLVADARSLFVALAEGSRARFDSAANQLASQLAPHRPFARDFDALIEALDPELVVDALSPPVRAWALGHEPLPPRGLHALGSLDEGEALRSFSALVVRPGRAPRRILARGMALLDESVVRLRATNAGERLNATVSALVLADDGGLEEVDLFERVYGFPFRPRLHGGALRTLVHRTKRYVEGVAHVTRADGRIGLSSERAFVIEDLGLREPLLDRLLLAVARDKQSTARDAARRLGLPLRTVQRALGTLVEDGACVRSRSGNGVTYAVEDTTFSEPTSYD